MNPHHISRESTKFKPTTAHYQMQKKFAYPFWEQPSAGWQAQPPPRTYAVSELGLTKSLQLNLHNMTPWSI